LFLKETLKGEKAGTKRKGGSEKKKKKKKIKSIKKGNKGRKPDQGLRQAWRGKGVVKKKKNNVGGLGIEDYVIGRNPKRCCKKGGQIRKRRKDKGSKRFRVGGEVSRVPDHYKKKKRQDAFGKKREKRERPRRRQKTVLGEGKHSRGPNPARG